MKWVFLFFISFNSYSQDCEYKGEVSPEKYKIKVEKVYKDMCLWWHEKFPKKPLRDDIILHSVEIVENFRGKYFPKIAEKEEDIYSLF